MPRALCVYLPKWPIQRLTIKRRGKPPERSVTLLIATQRGRQLIAACCAQAESRGVRIGMTLAHARSLLQGQCVEVSHYSPDKDRQALERLAVWALRFTPIVAVDEPDGLLMDIAGCEHLYGGELPLAQRIAQAITRLGLDQRLAVGPTFSAARMTARHAAERFMILHEATLPEAIAEFPIEALRIEPSICENLYAVGVERIDQLLSLPREALASRYGVGLLRCLDQLLGTATELIVPVREPEPFAVTYAFDGPVLRLAAIDITVRELLQTLTSKLRAAHAGASRLIVDLLRIDAAPEHIEWSFSCPTNDHRHLWTLIHPKLERVNLGFGVEVITLHASHTARIDTRQGYLWPELSLHAPHAHDAALGALLDRLIERLGPYAVRHPVAVQSYVPENAFELAAVQAIENQPLANAAVYPSDRPSRLFDNPEPVRVIVLMPDGPLARLQWRGQTLDILASLGPERITCRWWSRSHDHEQAPLEARDYFAVQDEHGRWLWLFRLASSGEWLVHGEWA